MILDSVKHRFPGASGYRKEEQTFKQLELSPLCPS